MDLKALNPVVFTTSSPNNNSEYLRKYFYIVIWFKLTTVLGVNWVQLQKPDPQPKTKLISDFTTDGLSPGIYWFTDLSTAVHDVVNTYPTVLEMVNATEIKKIKNSRT